jgi:molybdate transport system substrate-binding protein
MLAWLGMIAVCTSVQAADVNVAVAANFSAPMQKIAQAFEQDTGHRLLLSLGSTGNLYAQIRNGAPFQALLAADDETPLKLAQEGLAIAGTRFTYATGRLALWSRQPGLVDAQGAVLRSPQLQRVAVANPRLAPYGAAALEAMTNLGLLPSLQAKLVQGDNIAQTYQFVATGNAQVGFVALSQVLQDGQLREGSLWLVPASLHTPLRQDAVLLKPGQGSAPAQALLNYLRGDKARAIIRSFGYEL